MAHYVGYHRPDEMIIGRVRLQLHKVEILRIVHREHVASGWRWLVFGSVAEKVVRQAICPVLTTVAPLEAGK